MLFLPTYSVTLQTIHTYNSYHFFFKYHHYCHHCCSSFAPPQPSHTTPPSPKVHTPPVPSLFPDHQNLYLLPFTPINCTPFPLHLTSCRQHTSILLFLSSSHTSVPLPLILPIFQVPNITSGRSSGLPSFYKAVFTWPRVRGCTFLFVVSKCDPPQPLGWLVPMPFCCHHKAFIGA